MGEEESKQVNRSGLDESKEICVVVGTILLISSFILPVYEGVYWLKNGVTPNITIMLLMEKLYEGSRSGSPLLEWLYYPETWTGLSKVINYIFTTSLAFINFLFGCLLLWIGNTLD